MTDELEVRHFINPGVEQGPGFIRYEWGIWNLGIIADRYDDDGYSDLITYYIEGHRIIHTTHANLMATATMNSINRTLRQRVPDIPWDEVLTYVTGKTVEIARQGEPLLEVGTEPDTMKQEYRLWPILPENEPTTIYCPGGTGKSYLADYIACLVQFGREGLTEAVGQDEHGDPLPNKYGLWAVKQGNVLYLDWEATHKDHVRRIWAIKQGLGLKEGTFRYLRCTQPLVKMVRQIQLLIAEHDIKLVIIDSVMAAQSYGTDQAQIASQFYNALRTFGCTILALDHVAKTDMRTAEDGDSVGPYGSVVKYNRSRGQFELKKHQAKGQGYIELDLKHKKFNEGSLLEDIAFRIDFVNDGNGHLGQVTFKAIDAKTHPIFGKMRPLPDRIEDALTEGTMTVKELGELLDKGEATIRTTLNRDKGRFVKLANEKWGNKAGGR